MKNKIAFFLLTIASIAMIGCGGNGSGTLDAHTILARNFVSTLNLKPDQDAKVAKYYTRQGSNYIVAYNQLDESFTAYKLTNYTAGKDIDEFLEENSGTFFYDLERKTVYYPDTFIAGLGREEIYFKDPITGITFSKGKTNTADTAKAQELMDSLKIRNATDQLTVQFGLPSHRAKEVAGLAMQLAGADKSKMTVYQYDMYAKAILGTSISDIHVATESYLSGDQQAVESIYEKAAKTNGISKNSVKKLAETFLFN